MLFASKDDGLYYSPDYTATTDTGTNTTPDPQFYQEQNFPFRSPFSIVSNPYNSDQIWITTGGDGVYETDLITLGLAAIVQNVTAQSMGPTEALVSWQDQAPLPTNYIIQSSSNGGTSWSTVGTDPGSQDSSYLVTGLTAGTLYEFQVIANNTQGNSLASVATTQIRTDSNAGLIAYEGFSYANGAGLSGQTGGTGWATGSRMDFP
jgi:hypothetical protein